MVGVAGKSKGCATCRRRKIRCDQGRPTCQQCAKSKRVCEGYSRFPVFIVQTVNGVEKRKPLEEIKPSGLQEATSSSVVASSDPDSERTIRQRSPDFGDAVCRGEPLLVVSLHSEQLEKTQIVSWAYNTYGRTNDAKSRYNHMPVIGWLRTILAEAATDPALDPAMFAISARMFGVRYRDGVLVKKAAQAYTKGLGALQRHLGSADFAMKDETLAVSCVMALYELTDPDGRDPEAWLSHLSGIATLLRARGALRHRGVLARKTLEHTRYNLTQHCIISRKSYSFASPEWLHDPWTGAEKPLEQRVMDYGFILAEVLERIDEPNTWLNTVECVDMLIQDCRSAISDIEYLKLELLVDPIEYIKNLPPNPSSAPWDAFETQDINRRMLRLTAMGIQLHLVAAAHEVISKARLLGACKITRLNDNSPSPPPTHPTNIDTDQTQHQPQPVLYLLRDTTETLTTSLPPNGTHLAKTLIDEMEDTIKDGRGAVIRGRLRFPLRAALNVLRYEPASEQYVRGEYIMQALLGRRYDEALNGIGKKDQYFMGMAQQKSQKAFDGLERRGREGGGE